MYSKLRNGEMRGGRREGAGRKALKEEDKKTKILLSIDRKLLKKIDELEGKRSKLIEKALIEYYKIDI